MTERVITSVDQVTSAWLSAVLARSGALASGNVTSFTLEQGRGNWSSSGALLLSYSDDAAGQRPSRLFLKLVDTVVDEDESFGDSEVTYYTRDYIEVADAPLLRCYDATYSAGLQRYHLLLDDVSATHVEAAEKQPNLEYGLALAEALAILHACWWGGQRLVTAGAPIHPPSHIQHFVDIAAPGAGHILNHPGMRLEPGWPAAVHDLFARHPQALIERSQDANGFTLIHGDVGHHNVLVPRTGEGPLYIIDRQPFNWSLTSWLGVYDLAYALVLDWDTEMRRRCELAILRRYHTQLIRHGVTNYPWQRLYDDYRLCVPMGVYIATEYCRARFHERTMHVWWPMLQRALVACDDLDCSALW